MAKVRFYCDVPEYAHEYGLSANSKPVNRNGMAGVKRIAFDVEIPPDLWKKFDAPAQAMNVHVAITESDDSEDESP